MLPRQQFLGLILMQFKIGNYKQLNLNGYISSDNDVVSYFRHTYVRAW